MDIWSYCIISVSDKLDLLGGECWTLYKVIRNRITIPFLLLQLQQLLFAGTTWLDQIALEEEKPPPSASVSNNIRST